jgi:phage shock protein PspC (stress-responsive transcriptional regulator)
MQQRRLTRSRRTRMIAGVCGGIAEYMNVDPTIVRLLWAMITIFPMSFPLGLLGYLLAWIIVPEEPATTGS